MSGRDGGRDPGPGGEDGLLAEAVERMAHQIKNPLQAVTMNLEVIRTRAGREAPDLWEGLERFAGAVDQNVELLDRRLRLLLALGRRGPDDPLREVDPAALARDFAAALRLEEEPPGVRVEADGAGLAARARPGHLLALLLETWRRAARAGAERCPVRVGPAGEGVEVAIGVPPGSVPGARWSRLAEAAGGSGRTEEGEDGSVLVVTLSTT